MGVGVGVGVGEVRKGGWGFAAKWKAVSGAAAGGGLTALRRMVDRRRKVDVYVAARSAAETLRVVAVMDGPDGVYALSDRIAPPPPEESGWIVPPDDDCSWLLPRGSPAPLTSRGAAALMPVGVIGQSVFYANLDCAAMSLEGPGAEAVREHLNGWARGMSDPGIWEAQEGDRRTVWLMEAETDGSVYFPELKLALMVTPPPPDYDPVIVQSAPPVVQVTQTQVAQVVGVIEDGDATSPEGAVDSSAVLKVTADKDMARDIVRGEITDDHFIEGLMERMEEMKAAKEKEAAEAAKAAEEKAVAEDEGELDSDFDYIGGKWVAKPGTAAAAQAEEEDEEREDSQPEGEGDGEGYDDYPEEDGEGYDDRYDDYPEDGYDDYPEYEHDDEDAGGEDSRRENYYDRDEYEDRDERDEYDDREERDEYDEYEDRDEQDEYDDRDEQDDQDEQDEQDEQDDIDEQDGQHDQHEQDDRDDGQHYDIDDIHGQHDGAEEASAEGKEADMETEKPQEGEERVTEEAPPEEAGEEPPAAKRGRSEIGRTLDGIKRRLDRLVKK